MNVRSVGFRRSPRQVAADRNWRSFVEHNTDVIVAAGLPPAAVQRIGDWDDFLTHGYIAEDPGRFGVELLDEDQYSALVRLVTNYFAAGYEFYTPMALRSADQETLRARFDARA